MKPQRNQSRAVLNQKIEEGKHSLVNCCHPWRHQNRGNGRSGKISSKVLPSTALLSTNTHDFRHFEVLYAEDHRGAGIVEKKTTVYKKRLNESSYNHVFYTLKCDSF